MVGEKEYDLYVASKPPDISKAAPAQESSPDATATKPSAVVNSSTAPEQEAGQLTPDFELVLREDIKYLLKVFYLDYSLMRVREDRLEALMRKGRLVWIFLWALAPITLFIILNDFASKAGPGSRF